MSLLFEIWKLLQENMGYIIHLFLLLLFQAGISVPIIFNISNLVHFFNTLSFMNNFFIAHASPSTIETFQERHLQELGAFISNKHIFVSIPNVGVDHFWVDGKHVVAYPQCSSSRYIWSVHDLDLESMINFSTRVTRFDQTQHNDK
jgi:hypothetical protein